MPQQPEGVVVGQNPAAGTQQGKGSVITLQVSKGPQTSQVPDVTSLSAEDATAQLTAVGLRGPGGRGDRRLDQDLDGRVLSQDPEGGTKAEQGTTVVIVVGRFEQPQPPRRRPPP